ncbi:MAG TPA: GreA/GreB family elongation factor [Candidatus Saccharimonadales bacterium]|nr:GreA/GreB family elongation factor [Candidatus Saccharimonadales bacterium]
MNTTIGTDKITLLSKKGMKELKKEIVQLENDKQKVLQSLRELDKTFGHDERLSRIEMLAELDIIGSRIDDKKLVLSTSRLIPKKRSQLSVAIGSVVDLIDKHGHFFRFTLVDSVEANPSDGRISTLSPLGQNLIGKSLSDTIELGNGNRLNRYQLVRIT